jgi:hypothetical protein
MAACGSRRVPWVWSRVGFCQTRPKPAPLTSQATGRPRRRSNSETDSVSRSDHEGSVRPGILFNGLGRGPTGARGKISDVKREKGRRQLKKSIHLLHSSAGNGVVMKCTRRGEVGDEDSRENSLLAIKQTCTSLLATQKIKLSF